MYFREKQATQNTKYFALPVFSRGYSFIELLITVAIFTLVFSALFAGVQGALSLVGTSKAQAGALALMVDRMEYLRSLPYNDLGTVSGVPSGTIPQNRTVTINGIEYTERVLVQYVDDDADGVGGADSNGILADYKQVKIEYTWTIRGESNSASLVSNVIPNGIETTAGGGTIRVNVFDAGVAPVSGAEVRFVNNTLGSPIDTTRYTGPNGVAYLSGAPAGADYEITVTDTGYSTDGTYVATTSNPNPTTPPIAVLESQVSTMNFQIDLLSDLLVKTVAPATYGSYIDTFSDTSGLYTQASTSVSGGRLLLAADAGVYRPRGVAVSTSTTPATIASWYMLDFVATTSATTSVHVSVMYDNGGTMELIPDGDLPGNSSGFTVSPIDLSDLDVAAYDTLGVQAVLETTDGTYTPEIDSWEIRHIESQAPRSGIAMSINGSKSIGTDGSAQPVVKYSDTGTTDGSGEWNHPDIEYDIYDIAVVSGGYDIYEVCPSVPHSLSPDVSEEIVFVLGAAAGNMLRVHVTEADGTAIPNAAVRLQNTGVDELSVTSLCGQTYFSTGLYADSNYTLTVSADGYATDVSTGVEVTSSSTVSVILN